MTEYNYSERSTFGWHIFGSSEAVDASWIVRFGAEAFCLKPDHLRAQRLISVIATDNNLIALLCHQPPSFPLCYYHTCDLTVSNDCHKNTEPDGVTPRRRRKELNIRIHPGNQASNLIWILWRQLSGRHFLMERNWLGQHSILCRIDGCKVACHGWRNPSAFPQTTRLP